MGNVADAPTPLKLRRCRTSMMMMCV